MHTVVRTLALVALITVPVISAASFATADTDSRSSINSNFFEKLQQNIASSSSRRTESSGESNRDSASKGMGQDESQKSGESLIRMITQSVATSNIVVPDASAPRVLVGDSGSQANVSGNLESAKLIEKIRDTHGTAPSTTVQSIMQAIQQHVATGTVGDFIQSVARGVAQTPDLPPQAVVVPESIRPESGTKSVATSSEIKDGGQHDTAQVAPGQVSAPGTDEQSTQQVRQLEQIGQNIRAIETAKRSVQKQVSAIITQSVENTVRTAVRQSEAVTAPSTNAFDGTKREQKLQEIRASADEKGKQLADQISQSVLQGIVEPQQVDPVLKSSLQDIAQLVQSEAGVPISAPLGSRAVADKIQTATESIQTNQDALAQRDGLDLYRDSDHDGISDYDEVHIYHTDPNNAYSGGGSLTDGERILLGLDPHSKSAAPVPVESPKDAGVQTAALFEVTNIALVPSPAAPVATSTLAATSSAPVASASTSTPPAIQFSGRALPNSFVTVYIFSTPIVVTVKTDSNGLWTYTLDKPLEDGKHEMYVATVDDGGRILAKSPAIPFTKTAEALDYAPLTIQEASGPSPLDTVRAHFLVASGVLLLVFALVGLLIVGFRREHTPAL